MDKKRTSTEAFYITSKTAGFRNNRYEDVFQAVAEWNKLPSEKRKKFGVTCVETYTYFDESGMFDHREQYESWVDPYDYL